MRAQREKIFEGGTDSKEGGKYQGGGQVTKGGGKRSDALCPPPPSPPTGNPEGTSLSFEEPNVMNNLLL